MENEIKAAGIPCIGKEKIPCEGELNPDILRQSLLGEEHETIRYDASWLPPARPFSVPAARIAAFSMNCKK